MRFSSLLAPVSLLGLVSALPSLSPRGDSGYDKCIPQDTAIAILSTWITTLTNFDVNVATNLLAPSFIDFSDSINFLIGVPPGVPTFPTPQAYIQGQGAQPPIGFTVKKVEAITCEGVIVVRWEASVARQIYPISGMSVLYAVQSGPDPTVVGPNGYQLGTLFTEFNSGAWVVDIGGTCTPPSAPGRLFKA